MKVTHKNILLLTGIIVAVLVWMTFFISNETTSTGRTIGPSTKKTPPSAPAVLLKKVFEGISVKP